MQTTVCPSCQRRGTVAAYLSMLPLRCTVCGSTLVVNVNTESTITAANSGTTETPSRQDAPTEHSQPSITVTREPEIPPLVLSPSSPLSSHSTPNLELEADMAPDRLALYLKEIGTYHDEPASSLPPTEITRAGKFSETQSHPPQAAHYWPASIFRRFLARLILAAIGILFFFATPYWERLLQQTQWAAQVQHPAAQLGLRFAPLGLFVLLNLLLIQLRGQDIGKLLVGVKIVRRNDEKVNVVNGFIGREFLIASGIVLALVGGSLLSRYTSFGYLVLPFGLLALLLLVLDVVFLLSDSEECLHDRIAGTRVVGVTPN